MKCCIPEILAPVGGQGQLLAAVRSGADAVYFGMQNFNARRNAENFGENLKETVDYCHLYGVKVNITLNTLITDSELKEMRKAVDKAALAGVDALIIQDLAVASYVKKHWPQLPMHASTQMAVHNANGVKELIEYGFSRVVLARELSLAEIRSIYDETHAELEIFVHGAHCMSVSGNCYMSAMIGARSGNRGLCAQPCRLDWSLDRRSHVLSLKDLSYIPHLKEIADSGVCSIKIEGRMKRPEYVAAAIGACKGTVDTDTLRAVFSRNGFTDGYLTGRRDITMFGYRTKEDVLAANDVLESLAKTYEKEPQNMTVDMLLYAQEGSESQLIVNYKDYQVIALGDEPQQAKTLPLTEEYARRSLSKTGGTPFVLGSLELAASDDLMLPVSALNDMRRRSLKELKNKIIADNTPQYKRVDTNFESIPEHRDSYDRNFRLRFEKAYQMFDTDEASCIKILPLTELCRHKGFAAQGVWAEIPALIYPSFEQDVRAELEALKSAGLKDVVAENIGAVNLARELGFTIHGGAFLNILNSQALAEYENLGLADATISFELAFALERTLKGALPRGFIGYGYLPLMKFRACPGRGVSGCAGCEGTQCLTDRLGEEFRLICRSKQYSELLNCVPLYVADKAIPAADFETLYFTVETKEQAREVFNKYKAKASIEGERTSGLYFRELL